MRIEVDPDALIGAGQRMGSLGLQLRMLSDALGEALGGGIASGMDPAGVNFGMKYGRQAQEFANAIADAANAFTSVGLLLEATGYNYKHADAASTIGGPGPSGGVSGEPGKAGQAHVPMGPNGSIVPPPAKWHLVQPLLHALPGVGMFAGAAMTWPSGNAALMRLTATQWRNFSTGFAAIEPQLTGVKAAVRAQSIPEGATILSALDNLGQAISSLAEVASSVSQSVSDFATGVQETQDAIRRLLDRLSIGGLWDTVTGFLTGEGDDILREVARDVGTVLDNFQQQVKGIVGLLEEFVIVIGDAATAFQKWIRPVLVEHFGEGVGGFLADVVKVRTDFSVGAVTGLINTVSGVVALADADTWKGMAELAASVAQDPTTLPGVLANMGKEFVAWDKWSGDHPGRAAGEAAFNIGSLFVPGGALTKTGSVAKGLSLSRRVLEEGRLPQLSEVVSWTRGTPNVSAPPRLPEVPPVRPGPTPPLSRPDAPAGAGPGRVGESAPSSPGAGPSRPSTDGGAGQRAPVEQPTRGSDVTAPRPEPSRAPESGAASPTQSNGQAAPAPPDAATRAPESPQIGGSGTGLGDTSAGHDRGASENMRQAGAAESEISDADSRSSDAAASVDKESSAATGDGRLHSGGMTSDSGIADRQGATDSGSSYSTYSTEIASGSEDPIHSNAPSGDGWHRVGDDEVDLSYGHEQLDQHWTYGEYPSDIHRDVRDLISDPEAIWGRDSEGNPLTQDQYEALYNMPGPNGEHWQNWPPNGGALPDTRVIYEETDAFIRDYGTSVDGVGVDRIGRYDGDYLAIMRDGARASFEERSLPIYSLTQPYHQFVLSGALPEGWGIEVSEVAPAFGREGGGIQVRILDSDGEAVLIPTLKDLGLLR